ncbi:uncharacterized protein BJ171DRAFT_567387 [Polychytrium aggregatum]|uniref:uncharacterized protein n=1 Tax=Polychytrium aggregatum TaxID=110093 RepID=UPI0022FEF543|nr:uncharacterized protein BJ171DRAFT_567387 [Polychytrium aggregatum]KAI9205640.1 hypothetical protein BJ171DRAFT_567387 [Polychytrium aggregatum]
MTPSDPSPHTLSPDQHQLGLLILHHLQRHADAGPFLFPLDPKDWNLPDLSPDPACVFDLDTIERRLASHAYASLLEFVDDIRLALRNAQRLCEPHPRLLQMSKNLELFFDSHLSKMLPLASPQPPKRPLDPSELVYPTTPKRSPLRVDDEPEPLSPSLSKPRRRGGKAQKDRASSLGAGENDPLKAPLRVPAPEEAKLTTTDSPKIFKTLQPTDLNCLSPKHEKAPSSLLVHSPLKSPPPSPPTSPLVSRDIAPGDLCFTLGAAQTSVAAPETTSTSTSTSASASVSAAVPTSAVACLVDALAHASPAAAPKVPDPASSMAAPPAAATSVLPSPAKTPVPLKKSRSCSHCFTTTTPMWRSGPPGFSPLCNGCGVKWKRGRIQFPTDPNLAQESKTTATLAPPATPTPAAARREAKSNIKPQPAPLSRGRPCKSDGPKALSLPPKKAHDIEPKSLSDYHRILGRTSASKPRMLGSTDIFNNIQAIYDDAEHHLESSDDDMDYLFSNHDLAYDGHRVRASNDLPQLKVTISPEISICGTYDATSSKVPDLFVSEDVDVPPTAWDVPSDPHVSGSSMSLFHSDLHDQDENFMTSVIRMDELLSDDDTKHDKNDASPHCMHSPPATSSREARTSWPHGHMPTKGLLYPSARQTTLMQPTQGGPESHHAHEPAAPVLGGYDPVDTEMSLDAAWCVWCEGGGACILGHL